MVYVKIKMFRHQKKSDYHKNKVKVEPPRVILHAIYNEYNYLSKLIVLQIWKMVLKQKTFLRGPTINIYVAYVDF